MRTPLPATATLIIRDEEDIDPIETMVSDICLSGIGVYSDHPILESKDISVHIYFISSAGSITSAFVDGNSCYIRKIRNIYYVGIKFKEDLNLTNQPLLYEHLMMQLECHPMPCPPKIDPEPLHGE